MPKRMMDGWAFVRPPKASVGFQPRQSRWTQRRIQESSSRTARWRGSERTWGEYLDAMTLEGTGPLTAQRLRANVYLQTFECLGGAEPVLCAGDAVAGVRRAIGAGQAWLLGTYVGHSGTAYRDPAVGACVRTLLAACGAAAEHEGALIVRKRVIPGKQAWGAF